MLNLSSSSHAVCINETNKKRNTKHACVWDMTFQLLIRTIFSLPVLQHIQFNNNFQNYIVITCSTLNIREKHKVMLWLWGVFHLQKMKHPLSVRIFSTPAPVRMTTPFEVAEAAMACVMEPMPPFTRPHAPRFTQTIRNHPVRIRCNAV